MNRIYKSLTLVAGFLVLHSCATHKLQYDEEAIVPQLSESEVQHSFYLIGDAGNSPLGSKSEALQDFEKVLKGASENSTALFLGDNIYPKGLPKKGTEGREFAEHQLNVQTDVVKDFAGRTIFIPGNHDWYNEGPKGLERQEEYIEDKLGKNTFLPEDGCPIRKVEINDEVELIIVDTEWYLTKWDKFPTLNDNCEIRTRNRFFLEYESLIKKARGKTTVVALHHPLFSNGPHGGQFSVGQHMTPIPILGTLKNVLRRAGGVSPADIQYNRYDEFRDRIITLSQDNDKIIFVSGHEHSLQYLVESNLPQIISGAGSKTTPTRNVGSGQFSYGSPGYTRLDVFKDGSSHVSFFSTKDDKIVFETEVLPEDLPITPNYQDNFPSEKTASIYTKEETDKGKTFKWLWGERYRKLYSTELTVPVVNLDTLFGGLSPVRKGGGHQSSSLRFTNKEGQEYIMRAMKKDALLYIQAVGFKDQYVKSEFEDTKTEELVLDVFTGDHPYTQFIIGDLADAVGIFHTNPKLYYVPKQNAIGRFNDDFGDALYAIEERTADGHGDKASFGYANEMISTLDMLEKLKKNEDHKIDETTYVRARLFDMLIGDWDRHQDQWRWAIFKEDGVTTYKPVPRDRDQAFSIMNDGFLLGLATKLAAPARVLNSYEEDIKDVRWSNLNPFVLDVAVIQESDKAVWDEQATYVASHITDEVIDAAFEKLPEEVKDENMEDIKRKLKGRRTNLGRISDAYFKVVNKHAVVRGTDKDDWFEIERMPGGQTKVTGYRIKSGEKGPVFHEKIYEAGSTREIWVYGLDDDDYFQVVGEGDHPIKVRMIGGSNNDSYEVLNGKKTHIYDFKSKPNTLITKKGKQHIRDDYENNNYDYRKPKYNVNAVLPIIGVNPDDGLKIGVIAGHTSYGFERNPFTSTNRIAAALYTSTGGFDIQYHGEFAHVVGKWNLAINGILTSPNYSINFFGFGNSTPNPNAEDEDNFNLNYNRVKIGALGGFAGLVWHGENNGNFSIGVNYKSYELEETQGRYINLFSDFIPQEEKNNFLGAEAVYSYTNSDNPAFPTLGMDVELKTGITSNLDNSDTFGYVIPTLGFAYKISPNGQLVFATKSKAHIIFGDDFEFYQAASIGGNDGLRGYRNQRFTGKSSFYQTSDLRFNFKRYKTGLIPVEVGIFGGFDVGRIWVDDSLVVDPAFNRNIWNTSYGGGFFVNGTDLITANIGLFGSDDGMRFYFGFVLGL
ncbi:MAG: metallophosphoesterase [Eudoraea sp.]|uniref:metallophosphoesterase n=1 Tax=Eudoraea sp. TaxID=1979955 RepID=UPI0032644FE7